MIYNLLHNSTERAEVAAKIEADGGTPRSLAYYGNTTPPVDPPVVPPGTTDIGSLKWSADWSDENDGVILGSSNAYGMFNVDKDTVTSEMRFNGRKTMRSTMPGDGLENFAVGFGRVVSGVPLEQNTEIWFRVWVYHVAPFTWECDPGVRKFFRQREMIYTGGGSNGGSNDFNIIWPDAMDLGPPGCVAFNKESVSDGTVRGWDPLDPVPNHPPATGRWQCFEQYVRANNNPRGNGNSGAVKYWVDGVLVGEVTDCQTRANTGTTISECLFLSNWNKGCYSPTLFYWCAPAIAVRHSGRDDTAHMQLDNSPDKFPFIGTAI
jgi:hypothetical protein